MPSILVVEQEHRFIERISDALTSEGWKVRVVSGHAEALQAAASEAPDLVVLGTGTGAAESIASSFSRSAGGPGVIALLPEDAAETGTGGLEADELLAMPFTAQELRLVARRVLAARREAPAPATPAAPAMPAIPSDDHKLTSHDIFGDMLAEVEDAVAGAAPDAPLAPTQVAPPASAAGAPPARPAPAPAPPAASRQGDDEMRKKLEQTLSGVMTASRPRVPAGPAKPAPTAADLLGSLTSPAPSAPRPPAASSPFAKRPDTGEDDLDALISKTLSSLGGPARPAAPPRAVPGAAAGSTGPGAAAGSTGPGAAVQSPAPGAPSSAAAEAVPPAGPAPAAPDPAGPAAAQASAGATGATGAAATPAAARVVPAPAASVAEGTPARRDRTGSYDLAELERLARTGSRPGTAPGRPAAPPRPESPAPAASKPAVPAASGGSAISADRPTAAPAAAAPGKSASAPVTPAAPVPPAGPAVSVRPEDPAATQRIPVVSEGQHEGERFGQYTLLERIAVGGMAEVWKARMRGVEGFQKTVAIKKILPHLTDNSEFIGMFIDEAKLAAQLNHPNIVHIYDLGKIGRDYYIAMEYVEGKDLRSITNAARARGLALPHGLALFIAARLASALEYAHKKRDFEGHDLGLVHRDVSPQNVLLTGDGDIKLCDFGIAKAVSKASQTQMGALKGKLQYMSPEQAWGRAVDARSDIFSLGAILFELLTGERLFAGDSEMSVLEAVRDGRTRSPREIDPAVAPEVEAIVAKALARDPDQRFASAGEMQARLESALQAVKPTPSHSDVAAWLQRVAGSEERAAEAAAAIPAAIPVFAAAAAEPASPAADDASELFDGTEEVPAVPAVAPLGEVRVEESEPRGRMLLWAAIVTLAVLGVAGYFLFGRGKQGPPRPVPAEAVPGGQASGPAGAEAGAAPGAVGPAAPQGAQVAPAALPGAAPGQAAAPAVDVSGVVDKELAKHEQELKKKFEQEQKKLEKELALARQQQEGKAQEAPPAAAAVPVPAPAAPAAPPDAAVPVPTERPVERTEEPAPVPAEPEPAPSQQEAQPEEPAPAPAAPVARAKPGDLVVMGPGVSAPALVSYPQPGYPALARKMKVQGTVVVSVLVDENGRVRDAKLSKPLAKDLGLNQAALDVARAARYRPASKDGVRVKMWVLLKIPFAL